MKKSVFMSMAVLLGLSVALGGCSGAPSGSGTETTTAAESADSAAAFAEESSAEESSAEEEASNAQAESEGGEAQARIGSLKGPTSMGLVKLMQDNENGETEVSYDFTMAGKADELVGKIASGDLDLVLVPANVASVLYNKTEGQVKVIDLNTLGVLYVVASDESIQSMEDLKGKTVYMTGKGTTPEYVMNYLLDESGLTGEVTLEFKSEATEVASVLKENTEAIGVLPQPFATAACIQNTELKQVLDLTAVWDQFNETSGSRMVTGVTIVRTGFLEEHSDVVEQFLEDHKESTAFTKEHPDEAAELVAAQGIVEKAPIAARALPQCNIVCVTGDEMKAALEGYLTVLEGQDPQSVGGQLPGEDFYYLP